MVRASVTGCGWLARDDRVRSSAGTLNCGDGLGAALGATPGAELGRDDSAATPLARPGRPGAGWPGAEQRRLVARAVRLGPAAR